MLSDYLQMNDLLPGRIVLQMHHAVGICSILTVKVLKQA